MPAAYIKTNQSIFIKDDEFVIKRLVEQGESILDNVWQIENRRTGRLHRITAP